MKQKTTKLICVAILFLCIGTLKAQLTDINIKSIPYKLYLKNEAVSVSTPGDTMLLLESPAKTNLFVSPNGKYNNQMAPMVLFKPDSSFVFKAKVSAKLKEVYDVATLLIYQDSEYWAKFCYENSVEKKPTIVSVVTRKYSDDCNSSSIAKEYAYMAIVKKGMEVSFHYSPDGNEWKLIRHFRLQKTDNIQLGFAVHCSRGNGFKAAFSDIAYSSKIPDNLRNL